MLMLSGGSLTAQSAADQSLKTLPQTVKDNGENRVVAKTNTVSNNAMNKVDSASNKALKGLTGLFKKKKKAGADSTAVRPVDSTTVPKPSSYNRRIFSDDSRRTIQRHSLFLTIFIQTDQV